MYSMKKKLKQVAHSNLQSSFYNSPEIRQKKNKSKQGQAQPNSLHSLVTSTLDRTRRRNGRKMQRLFTKLNTNSSQLSLNITVETSILTRSQRKLLNSSMEPLKKSKVNISDICSMNPVTYLPKVFGRKSRSLVLDVERINSQTETSRPTSLENLKSPVSACSTRKSLDTTTNAAKQNKNMSTHPIVDCLMLSNSSGIVSLVCNSVLSQEKVKHRRTQRILDGYAEIRKRKYHLRSQSKKIFNPLKPAIPSRTSLPIDDLVCMISKPVSKKNKEICVSKPISNIIPKELDAPNSECKVVKISTKNSLKKEKSKSLPKKTILSGLQNSIASKDTLKRKRCIFNILKERNDDYEDDIFETKKFDKMMVALEISDDESDTTDNSIATPKCGFILTPSLPKKTPLCKECISLRELLEARKVAEEYLFRRNEKWKSEIKADFDKQSSVNMTGASESEKDLPEKKKLDYSEVSQNVINAQKDIEEDSRK